MSEATNSNLRVLSGIQPTGEPHLGNYFGAIKQHIELQDEGECFYFIANYHALTTIKEAEELRRMTSGVAATYLALGLDPDRATLFRQSDVPEVTELAWLLACVTGKGLLDRAHSYKDKVAKGITPGMGLYFYPVLMAADILIYDSHIVPVGGDQVQHVEMTRDMAGSFNETFGECFRLPEVRLNQGSTLADGCQPPAIKVPGTDGQKMSSSYGNFIEIFLEGKPLKKKVMGIVTDSTPVEDPKDPDRCTVFELFGLLATPAEREELAGRYRAGGMGYGEAKKALLGQIEERFADARERRRELLAHPERVEAVLEAGGRRAREVARSVLDRARGLCGL